MKRDTVLIFKLELMVAGQGQAAPNCAKVGILIILNLSY